MSTAQTPATRHASWNEADAVPSSSSRHESTGHLRWSDLAEGDRVHHFDYGAGTVDAAGPLFLYITWDNPKEHLNHHTALIARHLARLDESAGRRCIAASRACE